MEQAYPTLDGEAQSWANITLKAQIYDGPGVELDDIVSIKWNKDVERGVQRKTNGQVKKFTRGAGTCGGSIEFYADGLQKFLGSVFKIAQSKGYVENGVVRYGMVAFDLVCLHTPLGATGIRQVDILGCRIAKDGGEHAEGTDADKNTIELSVTEVNRTIDGIVGTL